MKKFHLIIKYNTPAPDFDIEFEANNIENAIKQIVEMYDLDEDVVRGNMEEMED